MANSLPLINNEYGSLPEMINYYKVPFEIGKSSDIDLFWRGFEELKKSLADFNMPFYRSTTTLLHLLLHMGYDCVKPDLILMNEGQKLGLKPILFK